MPRGGARPGAGRKATNPKTLAKKAASKGFTTAAGKKAKDAPGSWPFGKQDAPESVPGAPPSEPPAAPVVLGKQTPLEFLLMVMNNSEESKSARMQAAAIAAPYVHAKPMPAGKKDSKADAAKAASKGKFAGGAPPLKLVGRK